MIGTKARLIWAKSRFGVSAASLGVVACLSVLPLSGCGGGTENDAMGGGGGGGEPSGEVVLYTSVDDAYRDVLERDLEARTGLDIRVVGDTEATKTFGLITRLLDERERPRADVWWSSEPFGTMRLAEEGVLASVQSERAESAFEGGWPANLRGEDATWYGFAQRARVIVYAPDRVQGVPTTLRELTEPRFRGRVGVARPQFGTTRGHMGALLSAWGEEAFVAWLGAMRENGVRIYDGNAAVVRAVAQGEVDIGLTDTDDVYAGRRNGWDLGMVFETADDAATAAGARWPSFGSLVIPNTVSIVRGGPNPGSARELFDAILSEETERALAETDSRNSPVFPEASAAYPDLRLTAWPIEFGRVEASIPRAMALIDEHWE